MASQPNKARAVFLEAAALPAGDERGRYLDRACAGDPELRRKVEELLQAQEQCGEFLKQDALGGRLEVPESSIAEGPGTVIGRYKLLQQVGEGGFGVVFMAEQVDPIRRRVALKIVKPGMDTKQVIARFEAERQALALMDHPNIARVLDAGSTLSGRPYFVMELVHGVPLTQYCDANELSPRERLRLFTQVCHAVQHAHERGVVHRDLKPSNILVTLYDGKPVPKIIDFGTAKALQTPLTEKTLFTAYGRLIGTPQYMSPEQAEMSGLDVDARADIYALGVLLYELLTGTTPVEAERLRTAAFDEMMRIIRQEEPPRPSTRVSTLGARATEIAKHRQVDPALLRRTLEGDLDWIAMKALEKDRQRRYVTADGLAQDIERHLEHQPVMAGPPGAGYRLRKFVRRRRGPLIVGAAVLALCAALALAYWQSLKTRQAKHLAATTAVQLQSAVGASGTLPSDTQARQLITGVANVEPQASLSPDETMLSYADWNGPDGDLMLRDLKTGKIRNLTQSEKHLPGKYELCPDVHVWSPDSRSIAYMWSSAPTMLVPELRLVSVASGEIRVLIPLQAPVYFRPLDWSADGRYLLCDKEAESSTLVLVEIAGGRVRELGVPSPSHARLSPDGRYVVFEGSAPADASDPKKPRPEICLFEIGSTNIQRLGFSGTTPIWAPGGEVLLFSSDRLGTWDLWGVRIKNGLPASDTFTVRYGIGSFDKRLTRSGKLIVHRKVRPGDGYTIAVGAPAPDVSALEPFPGTIYLALGRRLHTLASEAGEAVVRPVGTAGLPSEQVHGGRRWFLEHRQVGTNLLSGQPRHELFAVALSATGETAIQLTDNPQLQLSGDFRWATDHERNLADGRISWVACDSGTNSNPAQATIYSVRLAFDAFGLITGTLEKPAILTRGVQGTHSPGDNQHHTWSPDGTELAFEIRAGTNAEIHVLALQSGQTRKLTDGCAPAWAPDPSRIAFRRAHRSIHTIKPDGSDLKTVIQREKRPGVDEMHPLPGYYDLVWSPDSTMLLYGFFELGGAGHEVYRIPATGGEPRLLTRGVLDSAVAVAWLKGEK